MFGGFRHVIRVAILKRCVNVTILQSALKMGQSVTITAIHHVICKYLSS